MTTVTIVIIAYHGDRWIEPCLRSLAEVASGYWRVILVDNGGNSDLPSQVGQVPAGRIELVVSPGRLPFAEANNFALLHGGLDSEAVCFLNQDTVSRTGWLDACLAAMDTDPAVGAVTPLVENYDGTAWDAAFLTCARAARSAARLEAGPGANLADLPGFVAVPEITAAAMVVRTDALLQAGPFDPLYGSYYEDYDLCRRIQAAGYQVGICTQGRIGHFGGSVTSDRRAYLRRARWITRNRVIYAARWQWKNRPLGLLRYLFLTMPRNGLRAALGRSQTPLRAFVAAHGDLLGLLPRLVSMERDRREWDKYLATIGWRRPERGPSGNNVSSQSVRRANPCESSTSTNI